MLQEAGDPAPGSPGGFDPPEEKERLLEWRPAGADSVQSKVEEIFSKNKVSRGLQLQSMWRAPAAAVSSDTARAKLQPLWRAPAAAVSYRGLQLQPLWREPLPQL